MTNQTAFETYKTNYKIHFGMDAENEMRSLTNGTKLRVLGYGTDNVKR